MKNFFVIPVFVSHMGCPFNCIFCDQRKISGQKEEMSAEKMSATVDKHLSTIREGTHVEIGFYGGSFTGIPLETQIELLEQAQKYVNSGRVHGIRLSTRPDYINDKILKILGKYDVGLIELGVQSLDDEVLAKSCRGHTREVTIEAFEAINASKIKLGIQTMIGLPGDTPEKSIATARAVAEFMPETVRIYPTLVIRGTMLEKMFKSGNYVPLSMQEAVDLTASLLDIYYADSINVIRTGLQPTEELNEKSEVVAGPFHPAFRHLAESRLMRMKMDNLLKEKEDSYSNIDIVVAPRKISEAAGYKRENIEYLKEKYGFRNVRIIAGAELRDFDIKMKYN